jgi:DUF4097 and DUF4098 domain-containing protein YvlB
MKNTARLLSFLAFAFLAVAARATVNETFKQTYPLAADGVVHLENVNGDIDITAWDKAEVSLVADKRARDDEELKRIEIEIDAQPDRLAIKTKYAKKAGWFFGNTHQGSVRYKLMVPAGARLQKIDTVNSDITVTGVHGAVNLDTVNGSISASGLMADARLDSVNGSLRAEFVSLDKVQTVKLDSVNGRAEVTLPKGASASIKTSSVNGSSSVDQPIKLSHSGRHSLSGDIGSGGPHITLDTVNGSIAVREK